MTFQNNRENGSDPKFVQIPSLCHCVSFFEGKTKKRPMSVIPKEVQSRADPRGGKEGNCPPPCPKKGKRRERKEERKKNSQFE